ncbi:MAG: hypothetical protein CFE41_14515 [Burkholderiales bacterium PBB2]|nr:MAG: hypothetical protein CFE41_14515 [Burkholderiales bacterium PBB2]
MHWLLHAAVTLGALAAWITIVMVISGLWQPGRRTNWVRLLLPVGARYLSAQPTEHAPYQHRPER